MSPPVSPQQRRDRGSGPTDRGGSHPQPRSSFPARSAKQKNQQLRLFPNPSGAPRHLPYPRFTRGRGGHCCVSQFHSLLSTLNHKPLPANVFLCVARQREIGEVARLRAEGVAQQPQSGFPARLAKSTRANLPTLSPNPRIKKKRPPRHARQPLIMNQENTT